MLRSADFSRTTGMWLASANEVTDLRNPSPICCRHAGDGTGNPRCRKNCTTWPAHLEPTEVAVQVHAVQTFQIEFHVPVEHFVDRNRIDPNQT